MELSALRDRLREIRLRWLLVGSSTAVVWGLVATVGLAMAGVWLDLVWELSPEVRIAALAAAVAGGCGLVAILVAVTVIAARDVEMARRLDRAGGLGGEILTGWDLRRVSGAVASADVPQPTRDMARMAVGHAARLARQVPAERAVSARPLGRSLVAIGVATLATILLVVFLPGLARTAWLRFSDPYADVPPFARTEFEVEPGDTRVRYGDGLDIYAKPIGAPVERLELVLAPISEDAPAAETLPMFAEADGRWRAVLAKVTSPAEYYVRAHQARSRKFRIAVQSVPEIESVELRVVPPAYTGDAAYVGPVPKDGIAGLPGAKVELRVSSNRPLAGGAMKLKLGDGPSSTVAMSAVSTGGQEVVGQFEIKTSGKLELRVRDIEGQESRESFATSITRLTDERPFIRILQPREASLATPTANLPVELAAEDDYGISRVQLFRSLNDSRPLPMDVRRPAKPTRRLGDKVVLPLVRYGLEPGDEIKLFARVEDNDPAGSKGTESTVVTVRIISQEEFERMVRVRQGLQVLMSKYNQARRRLESVAGEMDGLRKKRKQQLKPGESAAKTPLADPQRRELKRLSRRLRDEAEAIRKAGQHMLPYDLDANLAEQLAQAAKSLEAMAKDLDDLQSAESPTEQDMDKLLEKLARQLAGDRRAFDERASQPLEHLSKIFPLIADQQRFLIIAARQRDLAERLASVKGQDTVTDPTTKARLRDLEAEQHRLRDDLQSLLTDIENHARSLPEDLKLQELRVSALKVAKAVRDSGAEAAMADAESALTEFAGTRGHAKAQEAAEILARFIGQCEGMGGQAGACLVFQPGLASGMGNTVAQLLAEMGMGDGSGGVGGGSGGGGYSARRGPGVGLYGSMPTLGGGDMAGGGSSDQNTDHGAGGNATASPGGDPRTVADVQAASEAGGASQLVVPPRYRQRVGQYFQRVADELGDSR